MVVGGGVDFKGWFSVQCQCGQSQSNNRHKARKKPDNKHDHTCAIPTPHAAAMFMLRLSPIPQERPSLSSIYESQIIPDMDRLFSSSAGPMAMINPSESPLCCRSRMAYTP